MVYWWKIVCTFSYISKWNIIKSVRNHSKAVQWVTNLSLKLDELCICDFQNSIYEKEIWDISYRCNLLEVRVFLQMQFVSSDSLKALANEDPLLRTHCCRYKCFPVCPRAQHFLRTQILCPGHKKCFTFCSEAFCVRNKCFPVCAAQETSWATMCQEQ